MDEKERQATALKKFSLISPVLNGMETSAAEYFGKLAAEPVKMPGVGERRYSEKTFQTWLQTYRRYGFDGLLRGPRSDKGKRRKISDDLGARIVYARKTNPSMPVTVLYEKLVGEGIIDPTLISRSTVYRYVEDMSLSGAFAEGAEEKELRRFSFEKVGELYQVDLMYGPTIKNNGKRTRAYLHTFLDDCLWKAFHRQSYEKLSPMESEGTKR